jgi:hypothetical protein
MEALLFYFCRPGTGKNRFFFLPLSRRVNAFLSLHLLFLSDILNISAVATCDLFCIALLIAGCCPVILCRIEHQAL